MQHVQSLHQIDTVQAIITTSIEHKVRQSLGPHRCIGPYSRSRSAPRVKFCPGFGEFVSQRLDRSCKNRFPQVVVRLESERPGLQKGRLSTVKNKSKTNKTSSTGRLILQDKSESQHEKRRVELTNQSVCIESNVAAVCYHSQSLLLQANPVFLRYQMSHTR